ncbi:MAG: carbonic anhydrase [Verrucomicrobia bacterium]|nr:carbonic anhydrase [Verrucomicrobiota bacterium]
MKRMPPEEALQKLLDGNNRYIQDRLLHPDRNTERREAVSARQEPFAIILGCSDSRVPPEIIFDQGVGDLFVVRVAGNVVGPIALESIEFSTKYLHSSLIIVLSHERCGAVNAVLEGITIDIKTISSLIEPVIEECKGSCPHDTPAEDLLDLCIRSNAKNIVKYIKTSPIISQHIAEKKIDVLAGYYDLGTGKVEILKI